MRYGAFTLNKSGMTQQTPGPSLRVLAVVGTGLTASVLKYPMPLGGTSGNPTESTSVESVSRVNFRARGQQSLPPTCL